MEVAEAKLMLLPGLLFVLVVLVVAALLARAGGPRLGLGIASWGAVALLVAASGVLTFDPARPPRLFLVVGTAMILVVVAARSRLLGASPPWWPVALQTMRVPIELVLFLLHREGRLPEVMTFEGRNFDILVGLTAPLVAWGIAQGRVGRGLLVPWNAVGLALLANIVILAITAMPGPLHHPWPGPANTIVAEPPWVLLPAFLVPVALLLHVVSLGQCRAVEPSVRAG